MRIKRFLTLAATLFTVVTAVPANAQNLLLGVGNQSPTPAQPNFWGFTQYGSWTISGNTVTSTSASSGIRAYNGATSGSWYTAFVLGATLPPELGIGTTGDDSKWAYANPTGGGGFWVNGSKVAELNGGSNMATGGLVEIMTTLDAVTPSNSKVWGRYNGGLWNNSGTANPATNTGGASFTPEGVVYPIVFAGSAGSTTNDFTRITPIAGFRTMGGQYVLAPDQWVSGTTDANLNYLWTSAKLWNVQNANKTWSLSSPSTNTVRYEVRAGDIWGPPAGTERSEIAEVINYPVGTTINVSYGFKLEPGLTNTAAWLVIGQFHHDGSTGSPPFEVDLIGDKMAIITGDNSGYTTRYTDSTNLVRGQLYNMQIAIKFDTGGGTGTLTVIRDGVTLVSYSGPLGFTGMLYTYWKNGIYREATSETIAAQYSNLSILP